MTTRLPITNDARAAVLQSERQAALSLHRWHAHAVMGLAEVIQVTVYRMRQAANEHDGQVPQSYLHSKDVAALLLAIALTMQQFGDSARVVVMQEVLLAQTCGNRMAQAQLALLLAHIIHEGRAFLNDAPPAVMRSQEAAIAKLFAQYGAKAVEAVTKALQRAILSAQDVSTIARSVLDALGSLLSNALTISRTESMQAMRDGALSVYNANEQICDGWTWSAMPGCCTDCAEKDGTFHTVDESLSSHPNCRCLPEPHYRARVAGDGPQASDDLSFD